MKTKKFFKLLVLEIFVLILVVAYFLIDSSDIYRWYVGDTNFVKQDKSCDLHKKACSITLGDGSVITLDITPRPIPLMKPIRIHITTKNINLDKLDLKVFATNMNMGLIEKSLKRVKKDTYEGEITLPMCIVGNMIWDVNIIANEPSSSLGAVFEFQTRK
ncbi:MAG: hypothetical protein QM482_08530 [Sulfurospirillum sp.]